MFSRKMASLAVVAALSAAPFSAMAVVIDTFNGLGPGPATTSTSILPTGNSPSFTQTGDAIGQWRTVEISNTGFDTGSGIVSPADDGTVVTTNNFGSGRLAVSNADGYVSTVTLNWDNAAGLTPGANLGGVSLVADGSNGLRLSVMSIDVGNVALTFNITDVNGQIASKLLSGITGPGVQYFPFSSFNNIGATDLTQVNAISLVIQATSPSADLSIDLIETNLPPTVPEPAGLSLFGAGLLGFLASRRKNRG